MNLQATLLWNQLLVWIWETDNLSMYIRLKTLVSDKQHS